MDLSLSLSKCILHTLIYIYIYISLPIYLYYNKIILIYVYIFLAQRSCGPVTASMARLVRTQVCYKRALWRIQFTKARHEGAKGRHKGAKDLDRHPKDTQMATNYLARATKVEPEGRQKKTKHIQNIFCEAGTNKLGNGCGGTQIWQRLLSKNMPTTIHNHQGTL